MQSAHYTHDDLKQQRVGAPAASAIANDFNKIRETTENELMWFRSDLEIYDLLNPDAPYSLDRCRDLQMLLRMLSRNKRSVQITLTVLQVIFTVKDVEQLVGHPTKLLECIVAKFKLLEDLCITLKVPCQDLLRYSPDEICGRITYYLMLTGDTINVIDFFMTASFYKQFILPRAWYYLLTAQRLTHERLLETILRVKYKDHYIVSLNEIKVGLHECLVQIAYNSHLNTSQKRNALSMMKSTFGFGSDQELINLYNSCDSKKGGIYFESKFLVTLMKKLSFGKKYFLEKLIARYEKEKTLQYYIKKMYVSNEFYKKGENSSRKVKNFIDALLFINLEIKKSQNLQHSDFVIAFQNAFACLFPQALQDPDPMQRQNRLMQFIITVELLIKNSFAEDEYFKQAIINTAFYVLKKAIENEETVEVAIFSMQILLNAIGLKESMPVLSKFCSIAVQAFLKFPDKMKIKKYTSKIINFYITDKIRFTQIHFKDLQYLMLKKIQEVSSLRDSISIISSHLYNTPDDIAENLRHMITTLQTGNEDIRILNTTYILELLEQQEQNSVRKVLVSPELLKIVYQGILEMPQDYNQEKSRQLSLVCAKVIASIGLCQPFVNDPLTLKATNQITLVGKKRQQFEASKNGADEYTNPGIIKSDHYNPLTNLQRYKAQQQDNTLELLAIPSLNELPIERGDVVEFANNLLKKIQQMTNLTDSKPQNFYYSQYLIDMFINSQRIQTDPQNTEEVIKERYVKQQGIAKSIWRYAPCDLSAYQNFFEPADQQKQHSAMRYNRRLCLHLITKIEEKSWREVFEACVPIIKSQTDFLEMLLPYVMYYALRFNQSDPNLAQSIGQIINKILSCEYYTQIAPILTSQDFIKICDQQDKRVFKTFIENDTKFKYVEKLFKIDFDISKAKDQNVVNFIKVIEQSPIIKHSFLVVKKIEVLLNTVEKALKIKGAQLVKAYHRCIYNYEETYRMNQSQQKDGQRGGFLDVWTPDETRDIVYLHRQLSPEDYDGFLFTSILDSHKAQTMQIKEIQYQQAQLVLGAGDKSEMERQQAKLGELFKQYIKGNVETLWKNGQFDQLQEWAAGLDIGAFNYQIILLDRERDNPVQKFEFLIALFLAEYARATKKFITSDELFENQEYHTSLRKIKQFFELLYQEFMLSLDQIQGEIAYYFKLFLHILYEVETFVHFMKDLLYHEKDAIGPLLRKEANKEKRKYERLYLEHDMHAHFERLLSWLEERSQTISSSTESLRLIYFVRRALFRLWERENEYAFYLIKLARIYRKTSSDVLEVNRLYKECEQYAHKIIDFELECAKYTLKTKNAHEAYQYLILKSEQIKEKCDSLYKATRIGWMPPRVYEKAVLLSIELQIRIDPNNPQILKRFDDFLKQMAKSQWEKPVFRYAQYLDELDMKGPPMHLPKEEQPDPKKRAIQKIYYYITSLKYGYKYIWQSFPRALELWFEFNDREQDCDKINSFMKQELCKLEVFKLASVLQILLSRYAHSKEMVRDIIILVLSKIAIQYPGQCAWWIFHFLHFDQDPTTAAARKPLVAQPKTAIARHDFARQLLAKIMAQDDGTYKKIMECEKIFLELKKLSEKAPPQANATTMELPQSLQKISSSSLVMPIEENLSPQLPSVNFKLNFVQTCLLQTTGSISHYQKQTFQFRPPSSSGDEMGGASDAEVYTQLNQTKDFPAFKAKPVLINGFLNEATIMISKEKPKKIGIIGTNRQVYNFLLKCDKYGDLRKEQRFIDFAVLCNKMLENDAEARKRNLRLRTYAIVPLSRSTGLIEWIQNTSTLKAIVGEQWKKQNIKGEMQDIKQRATALKQGETHEAIWEKVKEEIKPVLGQWMAEHYPSPQIWYEARLNFVRSTAIWSMIGYVIGLGDRHGDNILIHQHTGEVTHVDFDCIFEKGAKLKIPEIVPFRLTQNIMDASGLFREKGLFVRNCEVVQRALRKNSKNIISFLDSFIHDPLIESQQNIKVEIKQALEVVKQKLHGQIKGEASGNVSIEEQVEQVVLHAINDESLRKMYIGWMPWL